MLRHGRGFRLREGALRHLHDHRRTAPLPCRVRAGPRRRGCHFRHLMPPAGSARHGPRTQAPGGGFGGGAGVERQLSKSPVSLNEHAPAVILNGAQRSEESNAYACKATVSPMKDFGFLATLGMTGKSSFDMSFVKVSLEGRLAALVPKRSYGGTIDAYGTAYPPQPAIRHLLLGVR